MHTHHVPQTVSIAMAEAPSSPPTHACRVEVLTSLFDLAARTLVEGGRLVYWLPTSVLPPRTFPAPGPAL